MVEYTRRDPDAVGLSWMAWYAMMGEEDPAFMNQYLESANKAVEQLCMDAHRSGNRDAEKTLAELHLFLIGLEQCLNPSGDTDFKLELRQRNKGPRPKNKNIRARRGRSAALEVENLVQANIKQESAIAEVSAKTGISRAELFKWLQSNRAILSLGKGKK